MHTSETPNTASATCKHSLALVDRRATKPSDLQSERAIHIRYVSAVFLYQDIHILRDRGEPHAAAARAPGSSGATWYDSTRHGNFSSWVSAADFGATPDGTTDSTKSIQAAVDHLRGAVGAKRRAPSPRCATTATAAAVASARRAR